MTSDELTPLTPEQLEANAAELKEFGLFLYAARAIAAALDAPEEVNFAASNGVHTAHIGPLCGAGANRRQALAALVIGATHYFDSSERLIRDARAKIAIARAAEGV